MITWSQKSSLAISFSGWVSIISIWMFVLLPLTCIGAYIGERRERLEHPSRTTQIPRMIPAKRWYQRNIIRYSFFFKKIHLIVFKLTYPLVFF